MYQFPLLKGRKPNDSKLQLRTNYDYNALMPLKWKYYVYVRGLALNFMDWLACNYQVTPTGNCDEPEELRNITIDVMGPYLLRQSYAILNYKQKAEAQGLLAIANCKVSDVQWQLELLYKDNDGLPHWTWFDDDLKEFDSFQFDKFSWQIRKMATPYPFNGNFHYF